MRAVEFLITFVRLLPAPVSRTSSSLSAFTDDTLYCLSEEEVMHSEYCARFIEFSGEPINRQYALCISRAAATCARLTHKLDPSLLLIITTCMTRCNLSPFYLLL